MSPVGEYFKAHGKNFGGSSAIYFCDSHVPNMGFWMTSLSEVGHRTNVSGNAIGRTFHEIMDDRWCSWGPLTADEKALIAAHRQEEARHNG